MLFVFLDATRRHPEITLGAFMVYLGVLFIPMVLFWATVIGSVSGFLFFVQIFLKFKFINKTEGEGMFSPRYDEMIARRKKD